VTQRKFSDFATTKSRGTTKRKTHDTTRRDTTDDHDYHALQHENSNTNPNIGSNTPSLIATMSSPHSSTAVTKVDLSQYNIKKIASGKVREIFEIDDQTLLFVATDRISAYDVILDNVSWSFAFSLPCYVWS
jgi:hypothetical protein